MQVKCVNSDASIEGVSWGEQKKTCALWVEKSYVITYSEQGNLLNKKSEFISKCLHENKFFFLILGAQL